jgi:hypothetical protein
VGERWVSYVFDLLFNVAPSALMRLSAVVRGLEEGVSSGASHALACIRRFAAPSCQHGWAVCADYCSASELSSSVRGFWFVVE